MNLFYEITFFGAKFVIVAMLLSLVWGIALLIHERAVQRHVPAVIPDRRVGPADRRVRLRSH
jgi:hypothetical protein